MLCSRNRDLPHHMLRQLPQAAQETYQKAYHQAQHTYGAANDAPPNLDEIAHGVALASLEASYHKTKRGRWVED